MGPFNLSGTMKSSPLGEPDGNLIYCTTLTLAKLPEAMMLTESVGGTREISRVTEAWTSQLHEVK